MQGIVIHGARPVCGAIQVNGAKNAALPIMAGTLLTDGLNELQRVPRLKDVRILKEILGSLGMCAERGDDGVLRLEVVDRGKCSAPRELAEQMRASICVLGPLVARRGYAEVPSPGGCVIGDRPIDLHVKGLKALGAEFDEEDETTIRVYAKKLRGTTIDLEGPHGSTVLGTANVMMAATLAEGTTVIQHAACEPEVQDLARYLNACGARISGVGEATLTIEGVDELQGIPYSIIPDRIEAGTFAAAAAVTGGDIRLEDVCPGHIGATMRVLQHMGARVKTDGATVAVSGPDRLQATDFETRPYPGIPTDMQPQLTSLIAVSDGTGRVTESVYPDRFTHVSELQRLGARISRRGQMALVSGVDALEGATVTARDLRAGAGLVLAGLAAHGTTEVRGVHHLDRGYQQLEKRLRELGADIHRTCIADPSPLSSEGRGEQACA